MRQQLFRLSAWCNKNWSADHVAVFFVLLLGGIISVTPRMPSVWQLTDPFLYIVFDGGWQVAETFYGFVVALILFLLARRLLPFKAWPWVLLLAWLPFGAWSLLSLYWSPLPSLSRVAWCYGVLSQPVALAFGFALGRQWQLYFRTIVSALILLFVYLCIRFAMDGEDLNNRGFDIVLTGTWVVMWLPVYVFFLARWNGTRFGNLLFVFTLAWALTGFIAPQRMVELSYVLCSLVLLGAYWWFAAEPQDSYNWRTSIVALALFHVWMYLSIAATRVASIMPGKEFMDGSWYLVFLHSERFEIFRYWLARGVENFWHGVGLGWVLPAFIYNPHHADDMILVGTLSYSHGHNTLMNVWLQLGTVGLIVFLIWMAVILLRYCRSLRCEDQLGRQLAITGLGLMLIMALRNFSDDGLREGNVYIWFLLMGVILGQLSVLSNKESGCDNSSAIVGER